MNEEKIKFAKAEKRFNEFLEALKSTKDPDGFGEYFLQNFKNFVR